jgi:glycosyltransferase involved in cell wall biosynthesis
VTAASQVVVAVSLAGRPGAGGHAWFVLSWLAGLAGLGCRVTFVDRAADADGWPAVQLLAERAGVDAALLLDDGTSCGLSRHQVEQQIRDADLLLDVMGFLGDAEPELVATSRLPTFVDVDPGVGQQWAAQGLHDPYGRYRRHVTVGTRIGSPGCRVPPLGHDWIGILPPVLLAAWARQPPAAADAAVTTVGLWRGPLAPLDVEGVRHGQRVHEFRRYLSLADRSPLPLAPALAFEAWDRPDRLALRAAGWRVQDPAVVAGTADDYRRFVQRSAAELCVARESYVLSGGGWFSDRSATYLASGRPVVASDTGIPAVLPVGEGLFAVDGPDGAAAALEAVVAHPARHAAAAREVAETFLASDVVLGLLLDRLGASDTRAEAA